MKWVLLILWAGLCPVIGFHLRRVPAHMRWAAFAVGLMPFLMTSVHLYVAPISWATWPGWPKGLEVSALDFLAVAICFASSGRGTRTRQLWPWIFYIAAVIIALPHAQVWLPGAFYVWQLMRTVLLFVAVTRLAAYAGASEALLNGVFAAVCYQAVFALKEAGQGVDQATGSFGAQNLLGIMAHFALYPAFALLLAGKRGWWPVAGFLAAVAVDVLTASRATLGLAALGLVIVGVISCVKSFDGRKGAIISAGFVLALILTPVAISGIHSRQGGNSIGSSDAERAEMARTAWFIIDDYPLGTGPSQYVLIQNVGGYADRAGLGWNTTTRATAVHNSYLLVLAETGWIGLIAFCCVLLAPIVTAVRSAFRFKKDPRSDVLLGVGVALAMVSIHFYFEWAFILFFVQYSFAMLAATAVGLAAQLTSERTSRLDNRPLPSLNRQVSPAL